MYKNRVRSAQRGAYRHEREPHLFYVEGIPTDDAERRHFFELVASDEYRPKLGGWSMAKFDAARAQFRLECRNCGYLSNPAAPTRFALEFTRQHEGTKLIIVKRMTSCPKYRAKSGRQLLFHISMGGHLIKF